ncbi:hypothetical protein [Flammeovirga sp. SJP92]|uniref:hypothetical protein n=1 Tax=Flammeovirga sp. SJP92 TaxID=1775430 RepID=UPI00078764AC|nr:hypothetical protein [Flammeovirga sp. SJP92]KXX69950.1 hypothetical protein AVL50_13825 [Flammeovirga sp. SJP92]
MSPKKRILIIHGRAQKPRKEQIRTIWYDAIAHGLKRDIDDDMVKKFENCEKEFIYYGDITNKRFFSNKYEDDKLRKETLKTLKTYKAKDFTKEKYDELHNFGYINEGLADLFSSSLNLFNIGESLIKTKAPDVIEYWNKDSEFNNLVQERLIYPLRKYLQQGDEIMLIAHSLGTIISYDVLWQLSHLNEFNANIGNNKVNLFVTLGSPLGDIHVKDNLRGTSLRVYSRPKNCDNRELEQELVSKDQKRKYPTIIHKWINISAEDDYICHDSHIADDFEEMIDLNLIKKENFLEEKDKIYNLAVKDGKSNPHASVGYLIHPRFINVLSDWLS